MALMVDKYRVDIIDMFNENRSIIQNNIKSNINKLEDELKQIEYKLKYDDSLKYVFTRYNNEIIDEISELINKDLDKNLETLKENETDLCSKIEERTEIEIKTISKGFETKFNYINEDTLNQMDKIINDKVDKMIEYYYSEGNIPYDSSQANQIKDFIKNNIKPTVNSIKKELSEKTADLKSRYFSSATDRVLKFKEEKEKEIKVEQEYYKQDNITNFENNKYDDEKVIEENNSTISEDKIVDENELDRINSVASIYGFVFKVDEKTGELIAFDKDGNDLNIKQMEDLDKSIVIEYNSDIYTISNNASYDEKDIIYIDKNGSDRVINDITDHYVYFQTKEKHYILDFKHESYFTANSKNEVQNLKLDEMVIELEQAGFDIGYIKDKYMTKENELKETIGRS